HAGGSFDDGSSSLDVGDGWAGGSSESTSTGWRGAFDVGCQLPKVYVQILTSPVFGLSDASLKGAPSSNFNAIPFTASFPAFFNNLLIMYLPASSGAIFCAAALVAGFTNRFTPVHILSKYFPTSFSICISATPRIISMILSRIHTVFPPVGIMQIPYPDARAPGQPSLSALPLDDLEPASGRGLSSWSCCFFFSSLQ